MNSRSEAVTLVRGSHTIASAAIIADGKLLLVRQPGPDGPGTVWALPGGRVDAGELVLEAVAREVFEETGLKLAESPHRLLCVGQMVNPTTIRRDAGEVPAPGETATVFVFGFDVSNVAVSGAGDPDDEIAEVQWVQLEDASERLSTHPFPFMQAVSGAALAAIEDSTRPTAVLCYRRAETGHDTSIVAT